MKKVEQVIIVEGIHDIAFLKTFLEADFIKTEGTSIPDSTLKLIDTYKKDNREFIILTDPDYPGTFIRNKLLEIIPEAKVGFISKEVAKTNKKVGIEHSSEKEIMKVLDKLITFKDFKENITYIDLVNLGLTGNSKSSEKRDTISNFYGLGKCNSKQFLKRINSINITKQELEQKLKEIND